MIERFGAIAKHQTEDYGKLISVRVWYQNGQEVEYGITVASSPVLNSKNCAKTSDYGDIFSHYYPSI
jgi:hypothetical protein